MAAIQTLDSLAGDIRMGKIPFDVAAALSSSDKDTRMNGGLMTNPNTGGSKFELQELPTEIARRIQSMKVGEISEAHLQGKHTTSLYEMYPLTSGGYVIDSPGLRGFGLVDLKKEEIALYFPEMLKASRRCRFTPCTHTHEPGCAVKEAVDAGEIFPERYNSYLGMLEEDRKFR